MARGQSLYDWCMENGEWGQQILYEFGDGNNSQQFYEEETGMYKCPQDFSRGNHTKIKWTCKNEHIWYATINSRTSTKCECPCCTGNMVSEENNLLAWCELNGTYGEQLISEWTGICDDGKHYEMKNISSKSSRRMIWKCSNGHEWKTTIYSRVSRKTICDYCRGRKASNSTNLYNYCIHNNEIGQQLIDEWTGICDDGNHYEMTEVTYKSNKKMLWKCFKGHEWYAKINDRVTHKSSCGCCNSKIVSNDNSLYNFCINNGAYGQQLISEWTGKIYGENNSNNTMNDFLRASGKRVLWKCSKGHEWYAGINDRTCHKSGCPYCSTKGTSYPEQFLYRALKQIYQQTVSRGKFQGIEYDITIPEERTCIEYSGAIWHSDKLERDQMKADICKEHNVRFIQIYANYDTILDETYEDSLIIYNVNDDKDIHNEQLVQILNHILKSFNHSIDEIDIEKAQTEAFNFMHDIEDK